MSLEDELYTALMEGYQRAGREIGYWANYFNRDLKGCQKTGEIKSDC